MNRESLSPLSTPPTVVQGESYYPALDLGSLGEWFFTDSGHDETPSFTAPVLVEEELPRSASTESSVVSLPCDDLLIYKAINSLSTGRNCSTRCFIIVSAPSHGFLHESVSEAKDQEG